MFTCNVNGSVCVLLVVMGPDVEKLEQSEDFRSQPSLFSSAGSSRCDPQNQAGVKTLVAVTEEVEEFPRVLHLQERYPDLVAPCLGLHPLQAAGGQHSVRPQIGLDFTPWCAPTQQDRDDQMKVFIGQLDIAMEMDLPVNVHSRSAAKVTIDTMRRRGISRALLHNFSGKPAAALEAVEAGFFFSFPPAVCRNQQRDRLIQRIPLDHICLETDSPALGLHKNERNEPANIALSCSYIAKVKGQTPETVRDVTTQNAYRLFSRASR
ncbi:putative deoxyribonuclease tatdn3 isoform X2 [Xiphophorus maculatus]|uniref:putative deoxyribonuclease tatdn3 isoform X2 n=1 Tax=Xiphophorus maculatus TaxID=8083 RepID=UPI000C6E8CDB|nr:putative deoxyribonuclease tatdn3 isoform X2 [Xiphophorus maculatus]